MLRLAPHPNTALLLSRLPREPLAAGGCIEYLIKVLRNPAAGASNAAAASPIAAKVASVCANPLQG
jgi:hypothetical protein